MPYKETHRVSAFVLVVAAAIIAAAWGLLHTRPVAAAGDVAITTNLSVSYQRLEGFGQGSPDSLAYPGVPTAVNDFLRAAAIDKAYSQVGINMGEVGTLLESPGSYDQRQNDNDDPFTINWQGFNADNLTLTKQLLVDLAKPLGFTGYYLGAEAPNVRWGSPWLAAIRQQNYSLFIDEAAEQVVANVTYWKNTYGEELAYYMLGNEQLSGNHASINPDLSGFGPVSVDQQVTDLAKRAGDRLRAAGFLRTKFIVGSEETENASYSLAAAVLSDPQARSYIGAIGYHAYPYYEGYSSIPFILSTSGSGAPDARKIAVRNQIRDLAKQYNIGVWMDENSHAGDPLSFDDLRARAIHIHDEFLYANATAYYVGGAMWDLASQQAHFGNTNLYGKENEGLAVLINEQTGAVDITGIGYAIGHYARWIKPGATRVDAQSSDPLVQVTSFRDDNAGRLSFVLINNSTASTNATISLAGGAFTANLTGEQSISGSYWSPLPGFAPDSATTFHVVLPPTSVTSIGGNFAPGVQVTGSLSLNGAGGGVYAVRQSWQITLKGAPPSTVFALCAGVNAAAAGCTSNFGTTDANGAWTLSGQFDASVAGGWTEWLQFVSGGVSNPIVFSVGPVPPGAWRINGAIEGTYSAGQSWQLSLTGASANTPFDLCYAVGQMPTGCIAGFGTTDSDGAWTLSGSFPPTSVGMWSEWLRFSSGAVSNRIAFTVQ